MSQTNTYCSGNKPGKSDYQSHWDRTYEKSPEEKLGWYETNPSATFRLVEQTQLPKDATILNAGAGSTTLIDLLLKKGYKNLIATDISEVALQLLRKRTGGEPAVTLIVDDLTKPKKIHTIAPVDLWIDRAVLHFFTKAPEREAYRNLLKSKIKSGKFLILAQFNLRSAEKCSGLPVYRYSREMLEDYLRGDFLMIDHFDYDYTMPSGDNRPYIYTLFQKQ